MPRTACEQGRHGVGFVVVHDGDLGRWALYFWWAEQILLHQRLYVSPISRPLHLEPAPDDGLVACLCELPVMAYERQAWIQHVLGDTQNTDAYLADHMPTRPAVQ